MINKNTLIIVCCLQFLCPWWSLRAQLCTSPLANSVKKMAPNTLIAAAIQKTVCHSLIVLSGVRLLAMMGPVIPGIVANVFVMPKRMPAYEGAISRWLMLNPEEAKPPSVVDMVRNATAKE